MSRHAGIVAGRKRGHVTSDLIGVVDIAALLKIKHRQAENLVCQDNFPAPAAVARTGWRRWSVADVQAFRDRMAAAVTVEQIAAEYGVAAGTITCSWIPTPDFPKAIGARNRYKVYDREAVQAWVHANRPAARAAADPNQISITEIAQRVGASNASVYLWLRYRKIRRTGTARGFYPRKEVEEALASGRTLTPRTKIKAQPVPEPRPQVQQREQGQARSVRQAPKPQPVKFIAEWDAAELVGLTLFEFRAVVNGGDFPPPDQIGGSGFSRTERIWHEATLDPFRTGGAT